MAIITTDNAHYAAIAAAIRAKHGTSDTYKPPEMAAAIEAISGGGSALINGMPFMAGTFTLAADLESTYVIASPAACAPLIFGGEKWSSSGVYNKIALFVYLTPLSTSRVAQAQLLSSANVPSYVIPDGGSGVFKMTNYRDSSFTVRALTSSSIGASVTHNNGLAVNFVAAQKGIAGVEYSWIAVRSLL
jgi:hypothetical protein